MLPNLSYIARCRTDIRGCVSPAGPDGWPL